MAEDSVAQDQIRAFVDRIIRLKEEVKAINADIREIYAEAKGNGFDKTVLGKLVNYVEKRQSDATAVMESDALFELYLGAYDGMTSDYYSEPSRTHAHEEPEHDPETGEITEPLGAKAPAQMHADALPRVTAGGGVVMTSLDRAEGIADGHPIQPETVEQQQDGLAASDQGEAPRPLVATPSYAAPGTVTMESCPPEGIVAHPYAACWPVNSITVGDGIVEPIVKIGKFILDGRGRYFAARAAGQEYPTVQYDGTDPLMDCIRWNMASRPNMSAAPLRIVAHKLAKLEPGRADEIMTLMGVEIEVAA